MSSNEEEHVGFFGRLFGRGRRHPRPEAALPDGDLTIEPQREPVIGASSSSGAPYAHKRDKGQRRATNQDHADARSLPGGYILLIVADGVGGAGGGETASEETVKHMVGTLKTATLVDPPAVLREAVTATNQRVRDLQRTDTRLQQMATTLVTAIVKDGHAWIANVGDSRAYRCTPTELIPVTQDDSWVAEQVRAGTLTTEEAAQSPYQNVITKGIGVEETLVLEHVTEVDLSRGDHLLLCSDGLYRAVAPETIVKTLQGTETVQEAAEQLIDFANEAGGPDNISVSIFRYL